MKKRRCVDSAHEVRATRYHAGNINTDELHQLVKELFKVGKRSEGALGSRCTVRARIERALRCTKGDADDWLRALMNLNLVLLSDQEYRLNGFMAERIRLWVKHGATGPAPFFHSRSPSKESLQAWWKKREASRNEEASNIVNFPNHVKLATCGHNNIVVDPDTDPGADTDMGTATTLVAIKTALDGAVADEQSFEEKLIDAMYLLEESGGYIIGVTAPELALVLECTLYRARVTLLALEKDGFVRRAGECRMRRWFLT